MRVKSELVYLCLVTVAWIFGPSNLLWAQDIRVDGRLVGRVDPDGDGRVNGRPAGKFESDGDLRVNGWLVG